MTDRINKQELARRMAEKSGITTEEAEAQIDLVCDTIYKALKAGESVTIRNFGNFYIKHKHSGTVFRFNPSQKLKALFGWSSTYKGEL